MLKTTSKALKQAAADTQFDAEKALAVLDRIVGTSPATARELSKELSVEIEEVRRSMVAIVELWRPLAIGFRMSQVADHLGVSQPTVRKWVEEGLLERVPERSPIEATPASVARLENTLAFVRQNFPARTWTDQLAALLHDRDLQSQDWFREGVEQYKRGELVEL